MIAGLCWLTLNLAVLVATPGEPLASIGRMDESHPVGQLRTVDKIDYPARLAKVVAAVEAHFYRDPQLDDNYRDAKVAAQLAAQACQSRSEFRAIANRLLASLAASHTYYMTPDDWEYYHLAAIFESLPPIQELFHHQPIRYPTLGLIVQAVQEQDDSTTQWIVADVLPGGPASASGLRIGDRLLTTGSAAYTPVTSLWEHVGKATEFSVLRDDRQQTVTMVPQAMHPKAELLAALQASLEVIEIAGRRIGYAHFYSYAGREYQDVLEQALTTGPLAEAEALILDLRYGLGGADPSYLNLFNQQIPELQSIDRNGQATIFHPIWRKPVVLLVNETSRSGKEVLAYAAQKHRIATVVGQRTAGAVLAGSPFVIDGEDLLYLAVRDVRVDGQRLEGQGVVPDVIATQDLLRSGGRDTQREVAVEQARLQLAKDSP